MQGPVLWPQSVTYPAAFSEVFPKRTPPLRLDRDSVVVGCYQGAGPFDVQMTVAGPNGPQTLNWKVAPGPSRPANAYLSQLVQLARTDGGVSLPLVDSASLAEAGTAVAIAAHNDTELARQALASGNLDAAEKLAAAAVQQEPTDRAAKKLLEQVKTVRQGKGGAAGAPANIELAAPASPVGGGLPPLPAAGTDQPNSEAPSPKASNIKPACSPR